MDTLDITPQVIPENANAVATKSEEFESAATSTTTRCSPAWLRWERCSNVLLAIMFFWFAYMNATSLFCCVRLSSILILIKVSSDTIFHLVRRPAMEISKSPFDWIIGICGAYSVFFFRNTAGVDQLLGEIVQISGITLQVMAMFSLRGSIGFVAANRGVRTSGMYRVVRHPLYLAYCISFLGFVMNQPSSYNVCVYTVMVLMLFIGILAEERILVRSDEYARYAQTVRFRLIPGIL